MKRLNRKFDEELNSIPENSDECVYIGWNGTTYDTSSFKDKSLVFGKLGYKQISNIVSSLEACSLYKPLKCKASRYIIFVILLLLSLLFLVSVTIDIHISPSVYISLLLLVPPTFISQILYSICREKKRRTQLRNKVEEIQRTILKDSGAILKISKRCAYLSLEMPAQPDKKIQQIKGIVGLTSPIVLENQPTQIEPQPEALEIKQIAYSLKFNNRFAQKKGEEDASSEQTTYTIKKSAVIEQEKWRECKIPQAEEKRNYEFNSSNQGRISFKKKSGN